MEQDFPAFGVPDTIPSDIYPLPRYPYEKGEIEVSSFRDNIEILANFSEQYRALQSGSTVLDGKKMGLWVYTEGTDVIANFRKPQEDRDKAFQLALKNDRMVIYLCRYVLGDGSSQTMQEYSMTIDPSGVAICSSTVQSVFDKAGVRIKNPSQTKQEYPDHLMTVYELQALTTFYKTITNPELTKVPLAQRIARLLGRLRAAADA